MADHCVFMAIFVCVLSLAMATPKPDFECPPGSRHRSRAKPYFPSLDQGGFIDMTGSKLNSLQSFLAGEAPYVTLSLDSQVSIPIGTRICISEMNRKFNTNVVFEYRDTGNSLQGKGFTVCHICVHNKTFSDDKFFGQFFTIVVLDNPEVPAADMM